MIKINLKKEITTYRRKVIRHIKDVKREIIRTKKILQDIKEDAEKTKPK